MKRILLLLTLIPVLALADAVIFSGNDVKALKPNLDLFGAAKILTTSSDPSTGGGLSAPIGSIALNVVTGETYSKTGAGNTAWVKKQNYPVGLTTDVTGILQVANGGTGSATQNFVDLTSDQTVGGNKTFSNTIAGSISGNAATVTTNANLTGPITSVGNATSVASQTGTGSTFVMNTSPTINTDVTINSAVFGNTIKLGEETLFNSSTGLVSGGVLSVNANPALFNLSAGTGKVVDKSNPASPTMKTVSWSAFTGVTTTNLATADVTYVMIDATGAIVQQTTYPTPTQRRQNIFIGRLPHLNRTNITFGLSLAEYAQGGINQLYDLFDSLGPFTVSGLKISANGANLKINQSSGVMFNRAYNYGTTPENPHKVNISGTTASSFRYASQTTFYNTVVSDLVTTQYDNAGTLTTIPSNNNATIQRVFIFPTGAIRVYYGQVVHNNFASAIDALASEAFTENTNSQNFAVHIASIVVTKGCTSLQNTTCSRIVPMGKFGTGASGGGGSSTLQQAYNNSVAPQITTSTANGSVDIKRGSAADTDNIIRGQNGAGTSTFTVTGNGAISSSSTITATGNITGANLSGTNTGDLLTKSDKDGSDVTTTKLTAPYGQLSTSATGIRNIDTGNTNILSNSSFRVGGGTVSSVPNWTLTTADANDDGTYLTITPTSSGGGLKQTVTTNAAYLAGGQGAVYANVKTLGTDVYVCPLMNGSRPSDITKYCGKVPVSTTAVPFPQVIVPFIIDGTSNGIEIYSTGTSPFQFRKTVPVFAGQSAPFQGVNGAKLVGKLIFTGNVWSVTSTSFSNFSAQTGISYTASGSVSSPSTNIPAVKFSGQAGKYVFIYSGSLTGGSSTNVPCVFRFSDGTNVSETSQLNNTQATYSSSSTSLIGSIEYSTAPTDVTVQIQAKSSSSFCGVNYMSNEQGTISVFYYPPESKIYSQASQDYAFTNSGAITIGATTTSPTKGTIAFDRIFSSREGQNLIAEYQYEQSGAGSAGSGDYLFTLPSGLSFDSNIVGFHTGTLVSVSNAAKAVVGTARCSDASTATQGGYLIAYDATRFRVACNYTSNSNFVGSGNWGLNQANLGYALKLNAPIQGWQDYGVIVGSFVDTITTPSSVKRVIHGVDFYTTSPGTACTGTCSLSNYYGASGWITSIVRTGLGDYTLTLNSSYWLDVTKVRCQIKHSDLMFQPKFTIPNSSGVVTINARTNTGSYGGTDIFGTLECVGSVP